MPEYVLETAPATPYTLILGESDPDLDAIAQQGTTPYGRQFLNRENESAARSLLGIDGYPPFKQAVKPTLRRDGSPLQADDLWYSTTDHNWFYWSGFYWLSCQPLFSTMSFTATSSISLGAIPLTFPQIFIESVLAHALFNGPQDSLNAWTFSLERQMQNSNAVVTVVQSVASSFIQSSGDNQHKKIEINVNLHQDLIALNAAGFRFGVYRSSVAGQLTAGSISMRYRIAK